MDLDYGEEQNQEDLSIQGDEMDQGTTRVDEQSESHDHKLMKQGGGPSNAEQEAGQGPKTRTEEESKSGNLAG